MNKVATTHQYILKCLERVNVNQSWGEFIEELKVRLEFVTNYNVEIIQHNNEIINFDESIEFRHVYTVLKVNNISFKISGTEQFCGNLFDDENEDYYHGGISNNLITVKYTNPIIYEENYCFKFED